MSLLPHERLLTMAESVKARLGKSSIWAAALSAPALIESEPVPVEKVDREDDVYYIFTTKRAAAITARFALNGETGHLLEAEGIQQPGKALPPYVNPITAMQSSSKKPGLRLPDPRFIGQHPVLVWKPCRESTTRLLPFWLLTVRDSLVYVRVDGKVYTALTTSGRG